MRHLAVQSVPSVPSVQWGTATVPGRVVLIKKEASQLLISAALEVLVGMCKGYKTEIDKNPCTRLQGFHTGRPKHAADISTRSFVH